MLLVVLGADYSPLSFSTGCVLVCFFVSGFELGFFGVCERRKKVYFSLLWLHLVGVGLAGFFCAC